MGREEPERRKNRFWPVGRISVSNLDCGTRIGTGESAYGK